MLGARPASPTGGLVPATSPRPASSGTEATINQTLLGTPVSHTHPTGANSPLAEAKARGSRRLGCFPSCSPLPLRMAKPPGQGRGLECPPMCQLCGLRGPQLLKGTHSAALPMRKGRLRRPQHSHPAGTAHGAWSPEPPHPHHTVRHFLLRLAPRGAKGEEEPHNGSHLGRKHSSPEGNGRGAPGSGQEAAAQGVGRTMRHAGACQPVLVGSGFACFTLTSKAQGQPSRETFSLSLAHCCQCCRGRTVLTPEQGLARSRSRSLRVSIGNSGCSESWQAQRGENRGGPALSARAVWTERSTLQQRVK